MADTRPTFNSSSPGNTLDEQRSSDRNSYAYRQMIAPMFGGRLPSEAEFFDVECHDICTGGFAFFVDALPPFDTLVVQLGRPPVLKHVRARVANVTEVKRDGAVTYRVGCRFTGQVML